MADELAVYISVMKDSLQEKCDVLKEILALTQEQEQVLSHLGENPDAFDEILEKKGRLIQRMQELDNGFDSLFQKAGDAIREAKQYYKPQIMEMQNAIRVITDYSVQIQALERKNKVKFENFVAAKRKEIRDFKVSNKTANSYYQNMANQHHQWQSYFMDKKN